MIVKRIISQVKRQFVRHYFKKRLGLMGNNVVLGSNNRITSLSNLYMEDDTNLSGNSVIMNLNAKVVFKRKSGAAVGLTIITGNHALPVGIWRKDVTESIKREIDPDGNLDSDVIIYEDVWIGANVTILSGVTIGRGAVIGAGAVVRTNVPPYSMVIGNPAKVIGFCFTPEEIIEHETKLYPEDERLSPDTIRNNYEKFFLKRFKDIKQFVKL